MKQFVDKLISRLEKYEYSHLIEHDSEECLHCQENDDGCGFRNCFVCVWDKAKEIVNQLAEEYKGGWIPCSERLPELTKGTECFKQSELCLVTEEWWDGDTSISVGWYNQSGVWSNEATNCKVIAWMPLPEPYRKEGE